MSHQDDSGISLERADAAGVRHVRPGVVAALEEAARALGFAVFRVDLDGCAGKRALLARIAAALHFPDWFGHNLDALDDCLGDMSWCPADGYVLVFANADALPAAAAPDLAAVLDVFESAAHDWAGEDIPMWTFVAGEAGSAPAGAR